MRYRTLIGAALVALSSALGAQTPVILPNTAPGRILAAWVTAMNSPNRFAVPAFVEVHWPGQTVADAWLVRAKTAGGYDVAGLVDATADRIVAQLRRRADTVTYDKITITLDPNVRDRVASLTLGTGERPPPAAVTYSGPADSPATRAGAPYRRFAAWLNAFNSGEPARLQAFITTTWPTGFADGQAALRARTGGYDLISVDTATPAKLVGIIKERTGERYARFTLALRTSDSLRIERLFTVLAGAPTIDILFAPSAAAQFQAATISTSKPSVVGSTSASAAIDALAKRLAEDVSRDDAGSIMAAVVIGDSLVWAQGFGWADRDKRIVPDRSTIYRIGSISKTFTAVVLAQLIDRKVIALDDPVERYFPEIKGLANPRPGAAPITFRQLASHTAGIAREPALPGAASGPIAEWESKILASIPTTAFDTMPGARYSYSNIGYAMLGLALSRAAKVPFMQLVEDGIFRPLGMASSTYILADPLRPRLSVGSVLTAGSLTALGPADHMTSGYKIPNGGIYSTVADMARFIAALTGAGKPIVSDSMRRLMLTKQTVVPGSGGGTGYGLGLALEAPAGAVPIAGHSGHVAGYTCTMRFDPVSRIGVILLRNYDGGGVTALDVVASQTVRALVAERKAP